MAARGGSVVELHAYALTEQPHEAALKDRLLADLRRIHPELERATIVVQESLVNDDCPLWGTDPWEQRSTVRTPHPRILLADDGIRCDFPVALIQRARRQDSLQPTTLYIVSRATISGLFLRAHVTGSFTWPAFPDAETAYHYRDRRRQGAELHCRCRTCTYRLGALRDTVLNQ